VIYHRGGRRVLRPFQSSLWFPDASALSAYSAVKLKDTVISLEFSIVPLQSLKVISDAGIDIFPHVCVGLDFGGLRGELQALELISELDPTTVVITGLMPIAGTPMASVKPDPYDFAGVFCRATELFPETPITLGCAHSSGRDRELIERIALECSVLHIALPTPGFVRYAEARGYGTGYFGTCCGVLPRDCSRIDEIMKLSG